MRPIPGFDGYFAKEDGTVWSTKHRLGKRALHELRQQRGRTCMRVPVQRDGVSRYTSVHRLVALAFHGSPTAEQTVVRHLDGDWTNNRPDNLAWGTPHENEQDKRRHGTYHDGQRNPGAKLTEAQARTAKRQLGEGTSAAAVARSLGVSRSMISRIKRGLNWTTVGADG